jgi:hypothetical protein
MPRTIHFHLDENGAAAIAAGLRRHGIDVTTSANVGLLGAHDGEQIGHALSLGRVIFTQDRDFLAIHASGSLHSGIVYCPKDSRATGEIIGSLLRIWELLDPDEMANRIEFI